MEEEVLQNHIDRLHEQTEKNTEAIGKLAASDAVQSVQIANLAEATKTQGHSQLKLINRLIMAIIGIMVLVVLALIWGALGERGFNGVTGAAKELSPYSSTTTIQQTEGTSK